MKTFRKNIHRLSFGLVSVTSLITPLLLTGCGSSGIVFADYESYISPDLIDRLHSEYGTNMMYYSTNEDIQAKFKNSYDIAIPSTYTILEMIPQLAKFDWKDRFKVKPNLYKFANLDPSKPAPFYSPESDDIIWYAKPYTDPIYSDAGTKEEKIYAAETDGHNAWSLFSDAADEIIAYVDDYAHGDNVENKIYYPANETLLNYGIPYFLQDWMFAYHGKYLEDLPAPDPKPTNGDAPYTSPIDWATLTDVIAPKYRNSDGSYTTKSKDQWDERFQPINHNHVNMEDDSRSVYDMCHIIYDEQKGNPPNVNPGETNPSINDIRDVYSQFTNKFNPNTLYLNTDGQQVLYPFAHPKGKTDSDWAPKAESMGAIIYSGDCLYAAMGGGEEDWSQTWWSDTLDPQDSPASDDEPLTKGNFHIVKPRDSLVCFDMMVMNKRDIGKSNEQRIYDVIKTAAMEGCDKIPTADGIGTINNDGSYLYGPMDNFYQVGYTSPLWSVYKYTARDEDVITTNNSFFDNLYPAADNPHNMGKAELLAEINNINYRDGLLELPLSNLVKSNMSMVYQEYKEKV